MSWTEFIEMEGLEDIRLRSEFMETYESAEEVAGPKFQEVDCNEEAVQRSAPRSGKWRRVRLAITACKRMRLVGESVKAVDAEKAEKIGTEINLAFAQPSQVPLPDSFCWPTNKRSEEHPCQWIATSMPKFNCTYSLTPAGQLRFEMESVEPLAPKLFDQVASEVSARLDSLPFLGVGPVEGSEDPRPLNMTPGDPPTEPMDFLAFFEEVLNGDESWRDHEQVVDSTHSATMPAVEEAMQSGIVDQFSQGSNISVAPWDLLQPGRDLPGSQVVDLSDGWTQSQNTSMKDAYGLTESGQCDQEPHEVSNSPQKTMQNDPGWSQISEAVASKIGAIFDEINQASDRVKLQNTQTEARDCSMKLQKEIRHFESEFGRMFNELKTTLLRVSKSVPGHLGDQLKRAMSQVTLFNTKELKHLVQEANGVTKKLDKIVHELKNRNLWASKMFQSCTSSVACFVESVLGLTSNFILVEDFNRYSSDLYKLPHFGAKAGKVV